MTIRPYRQDDLPGILSLFHDTVHTACAADYAPNQLSAWAPETPDTAAWEEKLCREMVLVAEEDGRLLGFGSLDGALLDLLYVHPDCQHRGVGSTLCLFLERACPEKVVTVHASRTARPFFEARGYRLLRAQTVLRRGVDLENFIMELEDV